MLHKHIYTYYIYTYTHTINSNSAGLLTILLTLTYIQVNLSKLFMWQLLNISSCNNYWVLANIGNTA